MLLVELWEEAKLAPTVSSSFKFLSWFVKGWLAHQPSSPPYHHKYLCYPNMYVWSCMWFSLRARILVMSVKLLLHLIRFSYHMSRSTARGSDTCLLAARLTMELSWSDLNVAHWKTNFSTSFLPPLLSATSITLCGEDISKCRKDIDLVRFTLSWPINTFSFSLQRKTGDHTAVQGWGKLSCLLCMKEEI